MKTSTKKIWLFGSGYWAGILVDKIHLKYPELSINVIDPNVGNLKKFVQTKQYCNMSDKFEFENESKSGDLTFIATPPDTHSELIEYVLERDCHCWVEKPLTTSSAVARRLINEAKKRRLTLFVDNTFLYDPLIRGLLRDTDPNKVKKVISRRQGFGRILKDYGVLWDLLPHDLSIINSVFGRISSYELTDITFGPKSLQLDRTSITASVAFTTEEGIQVLVNLSAISKSKVREIQVISEIGLTTYQLGLQGSQTIFTPWPRIPGTQIAPEKEEVHLSNTSDSISNALDRFEELVLRSTMEEHIDFTPYEIEIIEKLSLDSLNFTEKKALP
jgi:predicted dehydrogenase